MLLKKNLFDYFHRLSRIQQNGERRVPSGVDPDPVIKVL
jgi:hypothetical protein